jgi:hypothetical protein
VDWNSDEFGRHRCNHADERAADECAIAFFFRPDWTEIIPGRDGAIAR